MDVAASVPKLYGGAYYTDSGIFNFLFDPSNLVLVLAFVVGIQILIALIANYKGTSVAGTSGQNPTSMTQRSVAPAPAAARPVVPVVNPQAAKPQLQAPKVVPVAQKKTQSELVKEQAKPTLQTKSVETVKEAEKQANIKIEEKKGMDSTYEAYRSAMLGSGPRQQMESMKLETKTGSVPPAFRQSVANLKLPNEDTAAFLERTNVSVNDRMVAILDALQA